MSIAENIKLLRKTFGLTQSEFASKVNKTMRTVQVWESGASEPNRNNINDIINAFNVNTDWLRTGEGEMFNPAKAEQEEQLLLDTELLSQIIISVENTIKRRSKQLSPMDKSKLVIDIYKTCIISADIEMITEEKVNRAISFLHIP